MQNILPRFPWEGRPVQSNHTSSIIYSIITVLRSYQVMVQLRENQMTLMTLCRARLVASHFRDRSLPAYNSSADSGSIYHWGGSRERAGNTMNMTVLLRVGSIDSIWMQIAVDSWHGISTNFHKASGDGMKGGRSWYAANAARPVGRCRSCSLCHRRGRCLSNLLGITRIC